MKARRAAQQTRGHAGHVRRARASGEFGRKFGIRGNARGKEAVLARGMVSWDVSNIALAL